MVILIMDANKSKIGDMTLSISRFRSLLISNQGRVVESWVKITTYQCESRFQIWKLYKTIQSKFFLSRIWLFEAVKITQKILSKRILNKGIKKPRLQFNLRLALIDLRTTGPRIITNKVVSDLSFGKGFLSLVNFAHDCQLFRWTSWN